MAHSRRAVAPHLRNTQCRYVCPCRKVALAGALHPNVPKLRQKILAEIRVEVERVLRVPLSRAVGVAAIDFASWWPDGAGGIKGGGIFTGGCGSIDSSRIKRSGRCKGLRVLRGKGKKRKLP